MIYRAWKSHKSVMTTLATGGGKTIIFSSIAKDCAERGGRVLVLAHREELITQAANKLIGLGLDVGIIKSGYKPEYYKKVQVASVQSLIRRELPYKFQLCIVDEAHHDQHDNAYGSIRKRLTEINPDMFTLGVTATPVRLNGSGFKDIYEVLLKGITVKQLIEKGYLSPPKYLNFPYVNLGKIKKTGGDFNLKELSEAYRSRIPAEHIVKDYIKHSKNRQTIIFAIDVAHSKEIENAFKKEGFSIAHIDGNTPEIERKKIIDDYAKMRINIITNVGIFTEGYDCPGIESVILARPTESLSLYMQMSGRGLRPADGKENCLILDRANCVATHGLLESDREWELGKNSGMKSKTKVVAVDKLTGKQYELFNLPKGLEPEYIELREISIKELERSGIEIKIRKELLRLKYKASLRNLKDKWIWYRLISKANDEAHAKLISEVYCSEFGHKPGLAYYLVQEYKKMSKGMR